jgi:hypothetical protein
VGCTGERRPDLRVWAPFTFEDAVVNKFKFDFDCEVFEKAGPDGKERRIGGIVSTDHMDRQHEILLQEGLDFSPFLKGGWFNDNHDKTTEALVGYPDKAVLRELPDGRKGWYVEGYLLKGHDRADRLWDLANALQKTDRKLGFSVEGQILDRDPKSPGTVRKAVVREVAITRCPVNEQTALSVLAKSLSAGSAVSDPGVAPGEGFPLRVEVLEKKKRKKMKKSEAIAALLKLNPRCSSDLAIKIVEFAQKWHPAT